MWTLISSFWECASCSSSGISPRNVAESLQRYVIVSVPPIHASKAERHRKSKNRAASSRRRPNGKAARNHFAGPGWKDPSRVFNTALKTRPRRVIHSSRTRFIDPNTVSEEILVTAFRFHTSSSPPPSCPCPTVQGCTKKQFSKIAHWH